MDAAEPARKRFDLIGWALDEHLRRLLAAAEARVLGRGGVTAVATATEVSRRAAGLKELAARPEGTPLAAGRIRRPGAGRKRLVEQLEFYLFF